MKEKESKKKLNKKEWAEIKREAEEDKEVDKENYAEVEE